MADRPVRWSAAPERLAGINNPLSPVEDAAINHPWIVVLALAGLATTVWLADITRRRTATAAGDAPTHHLSTMSPTGPQSPTR